MEENENKQRPHEEIDNFSNILFGDRKQRDTSKESENNSNEQNERSSYQSRYNRIDEWFFGSRRKEPEKPEDSAPTTQNQIENILNNVDFDLLMETVDMFVDTAKQFKPIMKEISPVVNKLMKKFKSNK